MMMLLLMMMDVHYDSYFVLNVYLNVLNMTFTKNDMLLGTEKNKVKLLNIALQKPHTPVQTDTDTPDKHLHILLYNVNVKNINYIPQTAVSILHYCVIFECVISF